MYSKQLIVLTPDSKISACDMVNFWVCSDCEYIVLIHPPAETLEGNIVQPYTKLHCKEVIIFEGLRHAQDFLIDTYDNSKFRLVNMTKDTITFEEIYETK